MTELKLPDSKVALIDLDGTIIDDEYQVTSADFESAVDEAQEAGWKLGLSSDSPYEALENWRERFGMQGPIVAEKGAVVEDLEGNLHFDESISEHYSSMQFAVSSYFKQAGIAVWEGNPAEAIRENQRVMDEDGPVVLMSNERRCSAALFFRHQKPEGLVADRHLIDAHLRGVRSLYPIGQSLAEDLNYEQSLVIVTNHNVDKRTGTMRLQSLSNIGRVVMIGNSLADYVGDDIATHYAVQNASQEFTDLADHIASAPLTAGVVEILKQLKQ